MAEQPVVIEAAEDTEEVPQESAQDEQDSREKTQRIKFVPILKLSVVQNLVRLLDTHFQCKLVNREDKIEADDEPKENIERDPARRVIIVADLSNSPIERCFKRADVFPLVCLNGNHCNLIFFTTFLKASVSGWDFVVVLAFRLVLGCLIAVT